MSNEMLVTAHLHIRLDEEASPEKVERATRQLRDELRGTVESVEQPTAGPTPAGTRGVDAAALGELLLTVLPVALPLVAEMIKGWCERAGGRQVQVKVQGPEGRSVEVVITGDVPLEQIQQIMTVVKDAYPSERP